MLTQERYQSILSTVNERGAVTVSELAELLGISESTVRRDLTALDELGKLKKVFGGATSIIKPEGNFEDNVSMREGI
ncbi:MAG: DeoR/GlpR transcriptional regulator, partial [Ruminococcus sp.]|nr:DeoR/GlpR transcriptional regulator [Ruminococcus sp.]